MFDARSILDILLGGGPARQGRQTDPKVFKDMLDQLGTQDGPGRAPTPDAAPQQAPGRMADQRYPQPSPEAPGQPGPGGMSLEDLLRGILGGAQQQQGGAAGQAGAPGTQGPATPGAPEVGQELQDLLRQILQGGAPAGSSGGGGSTKVPVNRLTGEGGTAGGAAGQGVSEGAGEPGIAEILRQVLGQATAGAREGAARIDEATGLSDRAREALGQATGQSPEELMARVRELIAQNQMATGAALGGLGAIVLGTRAGRSLATTAIKLGGLAMIGGLAYKAYQNYQLGRPPLSAGQPGEIKPQTLIPAPEGSGFEARAITHDAARLYIRAMIAAAAADGRIDADEQQRILGGLQQAGLADAAEQFLAAEIGNPATVADLASGVTSPEEAVQVYTAARLAVDADAPEEHAFLSALADALGMDAELAAQVDAAARGTGA